jgi:hypothetical protein
VRYLIHTYFSTNVLSATARWWWWRRWLSLIDIIIIIIMRTAYRTQKSQYLLWCWITWIRVWNFQILCHFTTMSVAKIRGVGDRSVRKHGRLREWRWQGTADVLGEKPVRVRLSLPQIPHGLAYDWTRVSAVTLRHLSLVLSIPYFKRKRYMCSFV